MSTSQIKHPLKRFPLAALALGLAMAEPASAVETININQMNFNGLYTATGTIDLTTTGSVFTSVDPFFNAHWTATVQTVFTSSGTWAGTSPQGAFSYQFTLNTAAGDVAAVGTYFDWNGNYGIPVLTVFNCGSGNPGDQCTGTSHPMATPPFPGQQPGFNGPVGSAGSDIRTTATVGGNNVVINVVSYLQSVDSSLNLDPASLSITAGPALGTVTVNNATGEITYQPPANATDECKSDQLSYTINNTAVNPVVPVTAKIFVDIGPSGALCEKNGLTVTPGPTDTDGDARVTLSELLSAGVGSDSAVITACVGGCFDYSVTGVAPGGTATLVLELDEPIPPVPKLRKWDGSAWGDFVENASNTVASAAKVNGVCPTSKYSTGLLPGNECLQITIQDGGPNDTDGAANGTIVDPLGVGKELIPAADTPLGSTFGGGAGCALAKGPAPWTQHLEWLLLALTGAAAGMSRRLRRH
ncbi:choice-of-anchor U domain-containing protein [Thiohalobacter sp.]|uniref:choice-of-anchor U domain-containing protein n=1 Tax=Thiohalobacter sp. TaxID=2025948 RepID=UPI002634A950|nr:choice-of-anchor U domain-containing protein [Thiohalobacter sp.]